jgi:iron complex outermembrane recepter protein
VSSGIIGTEQDNGYNGEYGGFTLLNSLNAGTAIVQGWEFSYMQQLSFLPGLLKGFSLNLNLTLIDARGNFGSAGNRARNQVEGFVPLTGNVSLSWRHRRFSTRVLYSYTDESIRTYNATNPALNYFMMEREIVNLGFAYELRPNLSLQFDIANLFNEPQRYYRGIPDRLATYLMQGTTISAGVSGRF